MSWLSDFLHPKKGYDKAEDQIRQALGQAQGYQQPFQQAGAGQIPGLTGAIGNLLNPVDLQKQWTESYQTSPYAQQLMESSKNQGLDAASSMGLEGSSAALNNIQTTGTNLMNADRQQYLQDLMQKYMTGVGASQNLVNTGASAGANMGSNTMNAGENLAGIEFGKQNAGSNMLKQIMGMIGTGAGEYLTGGFGVGGGGRGAWAPSWMK